MEKILNFFRYKIMYPFRNFFLNIYNIIVWSPILWKDREWDYCFMLTIERHKLKRMCRWYLKNNFGIAVTGKQVYRQMSLAVRLLDILLDDDWWSIKNSDRPLIVDGKYQRHDDSDYIVDAYVNLNNFKRYMPYLTQEAIDKMPNFWKVDLRRAKAWKLYHQLRNQYMEGWWD